MAKIKLKDRSARAKGLIKLLQDKTTTKRALLDYGEISDRETDLTIIELYIVHPNTVNNTLGNCIRIAAQDSEELLTATMLLIFSNQQKFNRHFWVYAREEVDEIDQARFINVQNKLLASEDVITENQLSIMFECSVNFGLGVQRNTPLYRAHFLAMINNKRFDKEMCLSPTQFITAPDAISTSEKYMDILTILQESNDSTGIISWLFEKTGHEVYLSEDAKKFFCW